MLALNAIEEKGARVLYIAAEGGRGVQTKRVPKAWRARGQELAKLDPYWRVETAAFDLTSAQDRRELATAYASFAPDLVFVDVMTLVAGGANINETKDATELRAAAADLARRFGGATVVLIHHPNKQGMKADSRASAAAQAPRPSTSSPTSNSTFATRKNAVSSGSMSGR